MNSKTIQPGKNYDSFSAFLQDAGLRPTKQRLALAGWLFDGRDKHITAEQARAAMAKQRIPVSLATVYNTLNNFVAAGLLRHTVIEAGRVYFDTNTADHHHLYDETSGRLTDIPANAVRIARLPPAPPGKKTARVDIVIRVRD